MGEKGRVALVAEGVVGGAFKVLFPSLADRVDGLQDIVRTITRLKQDSLAAKALPRRLADAADHIADRLLRIDTHEFKGLDDAERDIAIHGVLLALEGIDIDRTSIIQEAATVATLRSRLERTAAEHWKREDLGEPAKAYGRLYLDEASSYVYALIKDLPGFDSEVAWETYILTRKIDEMLERAITSVIPPHLQPRAPAKSSGDAEECQWAGAVAGVMAGAGGDVGDPGGA
ncbi:MAG: hypothetical protein ABW022_16585 [Actinoplanes sp.]